MITKVILSACLIVFPKLITFDEIGGVIPLIQQYYNVKDAETASINTVSSIAHTVAIALVWLFGDEIKRRLLFLLCAACWIAFSLLSLILGLNSFMMFVSFRALGTAVSAVINILIPVILADLLHDRQLGIALMFLSVSDIAAILLNNILSSWIVTSSIPWQAAMLAATVLAVVPFAVFFFMRSNIRNVQRSDDKKGIRKILTSAFGMLSIKSYLLVTAEASFTALQTHAYSFWHSTVYLIAWTGAPEVFLGLSFPTVTALNSIAMMCATIVGVPAILWFAQSWRYGTGLFSGRKEYMRSYPFVTGVGDIFNFMTYVLDVLLMDVNYPAALANKFAIGFVKSNGLAINQLMLFAVVPSSHRVAAMALKQLISSTISIPSAQIVGFISGAIRGDSVLPEDRFHAYQLVLLGTSI
ncbi:hypothetical protein PRIPAC_83807, partial [Pristionchus pacificus]